MRREIPTVARAAMDLMSAALPDLGYGGRLSLAAVPNRAASTHTTIIHQTTTHAYALRQDEYIDPIHNARRGGAAADVAEEAQRAGRTISTRTHRMVR